MAMTIMATRNVPGRFRGFLASCMVEIVPGLYVAPRMKKAVRERVWKVMLDWAELLDAEAGVVLFWKSRSAPSGLGLRMIGWPKKELVDHEGVWLARRALSQAHSAAELERLAALQPLVSADDDGAQD
jgi:CRISPR-associated protein Cas2